MRDRVLYNSVRALLPADERIVELAHMWSRHRLIVPYVAGAFIALFALAFVIGVTQWGGRVGLGFAGGAVAAMAATEYRVLVLTSEGLVLLRSSKVRQKATELIERLGRSTKVEAVGSNLVITDWSVGGRVYSVMKRHQNSMVSISQR